jgi:hypothetical protein
MREKPNPREVLSANLRALMAARPDSLGTIRKVVEASGTSLSNGKVGRIYAASHTTDIDTLQHLANVFDLEPWQLLVEGLNPEALPRLADANVLAQILDAVQAHPSKTARKANAPSTAHQLERQSVPNVGTALKAAMSKAEGKVKGERRTPGRIQKPRGGGRV